MSRRRVPVAPEAASQHHRHSQEVAAKKSLSQYRNTADRVVGIIYWRLAMAARSLSITALRSSGST